VGSNLDSACGFFDTTGLISPSFLRQAKSCLPNNCAEFCQFCLPFANFVCHLPNMCAVCQTPFTNTCISSSLRKKPRKYVDEIDPRR